MSIRPKRRACARQSLNEELLFIEQNLIEDGSEFIDPHYPVFIKPKERMPQPHASRNNSGPTCESSGKSKQGVPSQCGLGLQKFLDKTMVPGTKITSINHTPRARLNDVNSYVMYHEKYKQVLSRRREMKNYMKNLRQSMENKAYYKKKDDYYGMYSDMRQCNDYYDYSSSSPVHQVDDSYNGYQSNRDFESSYSKMPEPSRHDFPSNDIRKIKSMSHRYMTPMNQKAASKVIAHDRRHEDDYSRIIEESELKSTTMSCHVELSHRDNMKMKPMVQKVPTHEIQPVGRQDSGNYFDREERKKAELPPDKSLLDELFEKEKEELSDFDSLAIF